MYAFNKSIVFRIEYASCLHPGCWAVKFPYFNACHFIQFHISNLIILLFSYFHSPPSFHFPFNSCLNVMWLDVPIMLVAGKDSFHSEYYSDMVEGTKSRSYNNNESQEETDELIKGGSLYLFIFLFFLFSHKFSTLMVSLSFLSFCLPLCLFWSRPTPYHNTTRCITWHGRSNPYRSCKVEERRKEATEWQTGREWKVDQRFVILQYSVLYC